MKNNFLIIIMLSLVSFCFSQQKLDSIIPHIKKPKDSLIVDDAYSELRKIWEQGNHERCLSYATTLLPIVQNIKYDKGIGDLYSIIGNVYNKTHKSAKAFDQYDKAIGYYEKANFRKGIAIINSNKSIIENKKGNLESAINYILKASLYFENVNDSTTLANIYNNIGGIYHNFGDIKLTKKYYLKSIELKRKIKSKRLPASLNNLALLYIKNKKLDSAQTLLEEALEISKRDQNFTSMASSYLKIGNIFFTKKDYENSKKYYDSSYVTAKIDQNKRMIAAAELELGVNAIQKGNYIKAKEWLTLAREDLRDLKMIPLLLKNYKHSAALDSARGDFYNAYIWQSKYQKLADDNASKENAKKIELAENRYRSEMKKLRRIDEQEKQQLKANQELFKYRLYSYISIGISILFLILLIVIIRSRKERNKYIKKLNESNQLKNKLFSIISHDLKNEIHGLDSILNLLKDNTITAEEFQEIVPLLANSAHQTSILLNNLLNWSKSQMKELKTKPTSFDIDEIIIDKFSFFKSKAESKNIALKNELHSTVVFADKDMFAIISQNLIANAIKFCNPNDTITVSSIEKDDHFEICFEDTGVGISKENMAKIFSEETFTSNGTQNETGTGLGLKICKELIELNKGEIKVHSIVGQGSRFYVTLPKVSVL